MSSDKFSVIRIKPSVMMMIHCERDVGETNSDTIARVFNEYMSMQESELTRLEEEMWKENDLKNLELQVKKDTEE